MKLIHHDILKLEFQMAIGQKSYLKGMFLKK
jgi:hypothetical protein